MQKYQIPRQTLDKKLAFAKIVKSIIIHWEVAMRLKHLCIVSMQLYNFCTIAHKYFLTCYPVAVAARQHRTEQPRLGPTRACAHFTDFKKTAISPYLSHLRS